MLRRIYVLGSIAIALSALAATDAAATAQRTFVASTGNDANPCSIALPCRGFAAALTHTLPGGEVIVLDSAGYGPVNITQSVSIIAPAGVHAGVTVFSGDGILINAGSTDNVILRGLAINSEGGTRGISVINIGALTIDRCVVSGFGGVFGNAAGTTGARVLAATEVNIVDSTFADNAVGLFVSALATGPIELTVRHTSIARAFVGIGIQGNIHGIIGDSVISSQEFKQGEGIEVDAGPVELHVANSTVRGFSFGVVVQGANPYASVSISRSEVSNNNIALAVDTNGLLALRGNELVHNDTVLTLTGGGVAFTGGDNYAAFNGSQGSAFTGTGGLE